MARGDYYLRHGNGGCPACDSLETAHKVRGGWNYWLCLQCESRWAVGPQGGWYFPAERIPEYIQEGDGFEDLFSEYTTVPEMDGTPYSPSASFA